LTSFSAQLQRFISPLNQTNHNAMTTAIVVTANKTYRGMGGREKDLGIQLLNWASFYGNCAKRLNLKIW
jgi:hypothetical protein